MKAHVSSRMLVTAAALALAGLGLTPSRARAQDPRIGLKAGMTDAGVAARNMELVSTHSRPELLSPTEAALKALPAGMPPVIADILWANSDMAFRGNLLFMGNFHGIQIYDIANPGAPKLLTVLVCPGGQGDLSVYKNLLFMSVEMPNGRSDCSTVPFSMQPSPDQFMGVRIFDISDVAHPKQVGAVQTCRGSHTHTLVTDAKDQANVYIYVSGTGQPRPAAQLAGCSDQPPEKDPNTSLFRIDVIKVPVAAPQNARIVNTPRIFADSAGNVAGLWKGGTHGEGTQFTQGTSSCHDITVYSAIGLAAGACSGNGILLDISDPANPKRIDQVIDPNFAYWHSATFNNDGSKLLFTDEWGGGMEPRCRTTDRPEWGADAIFELSGRKLRLASYYKLTAAQSDQENCVAHNGTLLPVPGRDIMVQAWYQGGVSVFDFTDAKKPVEIAYFDRGAYDAKQLHLGGFWSAYWYNGYIYGSEIGRGLDVFQMKASEHLSQNEIDAAKLAHVDVLNPQSQQRIVWPASFVVARAYVDQLQRTGVSSAQVAKISSGLADAEKKSGAGRRAALQHVSAHLKQIKTTSKVDAQRLQALTEMLQRLKK